MGLEQAIDLGPRERKRNQAVSERLHREGLSVGQLPVGLRADSVVENIAANAAGVRESHHRAAGGSCRRQVSVGDDVSQSGLACGVLPAGDVGGRGADDHIGARGREGVVRVDRGCEGGLGGDSRLGVGPVLDLHHREIARGLAQGSVDDRKQSSPIVRHGNPLTIDATYELVVGMARDDNVHRIVQASDDLGNGAAKARTAVFQTSVGHPTLVEQDHDGLVALPPKVGDKSVYCLCLVAEGQPLHDRLGHYCRCGLECKSDERDANALIATDAVGREDYFAGAVVNDVGGEKLEVSAAEGVPVQVALNRVGPTLLHPAEFGEALVKLVVAHAIEVQPHEVRGSYGWFVVKGGGDERRRGRGKSLMARMRSGISSDSAEVAVTSAGA